MNRQDALKAMQAGHKVRHKHFSDSEYLHIVNNTVTSEEGYNFKHWFDAIREETDWRWNDWDIVKICYECGKRIYPQDEVTLDDLNYAHKECLKG